MPMNERVSRVGFGVYVHFPFCLAKCPYCDFASEPCAAIPGERYAQAICRELAMRSADASGRRCTSIYLGGGTPSLWRPADLRLALDALRSVVGLAPDAEVTLEANPGAADAERFAAFREAGVNRLSIGVQSFDPGSLSRLGRIHSAAEAVAAFRALPARSA